MLKTYYTSTNGGQDRVAEDTLQRRVKDKLRNEFGKRTLNEVVSEIEMDLCLL